MIDKNLKGLKRKKFYFFYFFYLQREIKMPIVKCIRKGYNAANVMSGIYNGLQ